MSKTTATAQALVRSVLTEAYEGVVLGILRKWHLVDAQGNLRIVTIGADPEKGKKGEAGPIIDPDVLDRFLAVDRSTGKRMFDWMLFAAGGGEPHVKESERAVELAKTWTIENYMKGQDNEGNAIKPMTREEAQAAWQRDVWPTYEHEYFYADEDLAGDIQYPCFGWFRHWPGKKGLYEKVVNACAKFVALTKDTKTLSQLNKLNPNAKIVTDYAQAFWAGDKPKFKDVEALEEFVYNVRSTLIRRRAEQNVVTVGKNPEGGYRTGRDEILYDDDVLQVIIPLTAAASLKKGYNDWCISNRTRWDTYFKTRKREDLMWGSAYTPDGPFAFFKIKKPVRDPYLTASPGADEPASFAAHIQLSRNPSSEERIDFWDRENRQRKPYSDIIRRLKPSIPDIKQHMDAAIAEVEEWVKQFKAEQLERFPSLEAQVRVKMANALVESLLEQGPVAPAVAF